MNNLFSLQQRVYIEDVDSLGILYHANYLKFFERARTEWLLSKGFSLPILSDRGIYFVVRHAELSFKRPILLNALLEITVEARSVQGSRWILYQTLRDAQDAAIIYGDGVIELICVNEKLKPIRVPKELLECVEPHVEIPAKEKWLWENKKALQQVKKGLKDSAVGQVKLRGKDFT